MLNRKRRFGTVRLGSGGSTHVLIGLPLVAVDLRRQLLRTPYVVFYCPARGPSGPTRAPRRKAAREIRVLARGRDETQEPPARPRETPAPETPRSESRAK
eukprot:8231290-Alexandrium_andersonii.AAC.1